MDYELLVVRGRASTNKAIKLADGVTTVGRQDECQLRIKSSQVSRRHCELFEQKGLLLVKDLGSANGTFVNGKRIQGQRVLEPGDELTIGQVKLRVAKVGEPPPPPRVKPAAKKPGDTDLMGVLAPAGSGEDEFEIEFDGDAEPAFDGEAEPAFEIDEPGATPATAPAEAKKPPGPKPKAPAPEPEPEPEPAGSADDAIADFLLDIKLDEEE